MKKVNGRFIFLSVYVDDTVAIFDKRDAKTWKRDKAALGAKFPLKDLGDCEWILQMKVTRDRTAGTLNLSQEQYLSDVLERFQMTDCRSAVNPNFVTDLSNSYYMSQDLPVHYLDAEEHALFRSIIGSLMYAANCTRPDLAYTCGALSRHLAQPTALHLTAAKHVLRYVKGTLDHCLTFSRHKPIPATAATLSFSDQLESELEQSEISPVVIYTDASWANDHTDRHSTTGVIVRVFGNTVSWQSKRQTATAQSSTESEFYALNAGVLESMWFRCFLDELFSFSPDSSPLPTSLFTDNQSAICVAMNEDIHARSKHIDLRQCHVRENIENGIVCIQWVQSSEQLADLLTKALETAKLRQNLLAL